MELKDVFERTKKEMFKDYLIKYCKDKNNFFRNELCKRGSNLSSKAILEIANSIIEIEGELEEIKKQDNFENLLELKTKHITI